MSEPPTLDDVLASAAHLQALVPDLVLVGDAATAWHARHRQSFDHDHVLSDLTERYAEVVEAVEASDGWVTSVRASSAPLTLLGSLDGIEAGLRQLRRLRPLEVEEVTVDGRTLRVPTPPECLRVKAYLVVQRNQVRDYLDTVALAERTGPPAVDVLVGIDDYYRDRSDGHDSVLTTVVQRLSEPTPRDRRVTEQLGASKGLDRRWHDWGAVEAACQELADQVLDRLGGAVTLAFRNVDVDVDVDAPMHTWPYEAIVTVIERGTVADWAVLAREIGTEPWGPVARQVEEYLGYASPYGVGPLLARAITRARRRAEEVERATVAAEVRDLVERSGLRVADLAALVGTSRSRLSTYRSGRVVPSGALLVRLRATVERRERAAATSHDR